MSFDMGESMTFARFHTPSGPRRGSNKEAMPSARIVASPTSRGGGPPKQMGAIHGERGSFQLNREGHPGMMEA